MVRLNRTAGDIDDDTAFLLEAVADFMKKHGDWVSEKLDVSDPDQLRAMTAIELKKTRYLPNGREWIPDDTWIGGRGLKFPPFATHEHMPPRRIVIDSLADIKERASTTIERFENARILTREIEFLKEQISQSE